MNLKKFEIPDTVPQLLGLFRNILAAHIPFEQLGKLTNFISQHRYVQSLYDLARMDAISGVGLVSRLSYALVREQIAIRPRLRLIGKVKLALVAALTISSLGVNYLDSKKSEIKINGEAVLVAEDFKPDGEEAQIDAEIGYKETPFDFAMPVQGYVSQGYRSYHRAIDIATGAVGVPIHSLGRGQVEFAGYLQGGKGNVVVVDHGDGLKSLYAHMGQISIGVGNQVDSSTTLGTVGLTGRTTGAHVHLEIIDNNIAVDPQKVLPQVENPLGLAPKAKGTI